MSSDVAGGALQVVAADVEQEWRRAGLSGGFLARHLQTSEQLGFGVDRVLPLASVVKVPLALVVLDEIASGRLDGAQQVRLDPAERTPGPTGLSVFAHPSSVAVEDLVTMSLAVSDNAATDALLALVPPDVVTTRLRRWGWHDLTVRHPLHELYTALGRLPERTRSDLRELAVSASTQGGGHVLPQLDVAHANAGSAGALVELLAAVWGDRVGAPGVAARLRGAMGHQLVSPRLGVELASDLTTLRSKTGSFLNLRHEIGVVTTAEGDQVAIAALAVSSVPAEQQPEADATIGAGARMAVEALTA
ncbi:serine hydrolase [Auraticoccus monumenti]|uniref:Beta-lactamase class A n=1 Tax=Auraticoccus monumenti TaxID=675864 RepID=A0A1G6Z3G8_9ACTN|nr:serine hydrolase [Auraticoccus monumenti]SDD97304.1 beta-lactamase class A [Auraticoccus monumenti]